MAHKVLHRVSPRLSSRLLAAGATAARCSGCAAVA